MVVTVGVLAFGISMVLLPGPTQKLFNLLMFSSIEGNPAFGEAAMAYITFIYAVLGTVMFGWGVSLLYALLGPFRRGEAEGWRMVAVSVVAWFVLDTSYSVWAGFWQNTMLNLVFAVAFAVPLVATYKVFNEARN